MCSLFARYIECSLSGCCFPRADLTSSDKVWWSANLFASFLGLITLGWEDLSRVFNLAANLRRVHVPELFAPTVKLVLFNCVKSSSRFSFSCS